MMRTRHVAIIASLAALTLLILYLGLTQVPQQPIHPKPSASKPHVISTHTTSSFLEVGEVYKALGYPRIFWDPKKPNYTVRYHAPPIYYDIGHLEMPAMDLGEALEIASKAANITPQNYKLISAYFSPGHVVNGSLIIEPTWSLNFVRVFKGYWIWGGFGDYSNINVMVDAFRGVVRQVSKYEEDLPPSNASFNLRINSSQAIEILRSSNIPNIPVQLLRKGKVKFIDLRIARISPDAKNLLLQSPVNPKFVNKYKLYWFIILSGENVRNGNLTYPVGSFLVDAETGEVAAATYYMILPSMKWQTVFARLDYSSAENLNVENITITVCPKFAYKFPPPEDSLIKPVIYLSCFPLIVENVIVVEPGASGKIDLQIKPINIDSDVILSFEVVDPLGDQDIPKNLISPPPGAVAENGSELSVPIAIAVSSNVAQKTYLIELDVYWRMPGWDHSMQTRTLFLLSIWNGEGELPHPPKHLLTGLKII